MNDLALRDAERRSIGPAGHAAVPERQDPRLPVMRVATRHLAADQQFDHWRHAAVPYLDTIRPYVPAGAGFEASGAALRAGSFMFYTAHLPPYGYGRSMAGIRRDSLDHWILALCRNGSQVQSDGDRAVDMQPGTPHLFSMARPFEAERSGGPRVDWHSVFIARDAMPELEAALAAAEFGAVRSPFTPLLTSFLATLPEMIDAMTVEDLPHLAATTRALVAAVFARTGRDHPVMPQVAALQLTRIKRLVRENIGAATLGPARLCRLAGMSRSQLYRLFEPLGGVASHIQRERLAFAHRLLADPAERRDVARIAEAAGFFDPSSFSRAFRREFGLSPRDLRQDALAGGSALAMPISRPASGARTLLAELRRL